MVNKKKQRLHKKFVTKVNNKCPWTTINYRMSKKLNREGVLLGSSYKSEPKSYKVKEDNGGSLSTSARALWHSSYPNISNSQTHPGLYSRSHKSGNAESHSKWTSSKATRSCRVGGIFSGHIDEFKKKNPSHPSRPLSEFKKNNSRTTSVGVGVNWTKERRVNKMLNSIIVKPYHVDLMKMKDVKEFTHRLKHMIMLLELVGKRCNNCQNQQQISKNQSRIGNVHRQNKKRKYQGRIGNRHRQVRKKNRYNITKTKYRKRIKLNKMESRRMKPKKMESTIKESKRMESMRMKQKGVQKRMESTTTKSNGTEMKRKTNIFKPIATKNISDQSKLELARVIQARKQDFLEHSIIPNNSRIGLVNDSSPGSLSRLRLVLGVHRVVEPKALRIRDVFPVARRIIPNSNITRSTTLQPNNFKVDLVKSERIGPTKQGVPIVQPVKIGPIPGGK